MEKLIYYKIFTKELKSLGLRNNPNILQFTPNEWYYLENDQIKEGISDFGGIWVCKSLGGANGLTKYMFTKEVSVETRAFEVRIGNILFTNSYRVKTNAVYLDREIDLLSKVKEKLLLKK